MFQRHCYCSLHSPRAKNPKGTDLYEFDVYWGGTSGEFRQKRTVKARTYKDACIQAAKCSEHCRFMTRYLVVGLSDSARDPEINYDYFKDQAGAQLFVIRRILEAPPQWNACCHCREQEKSWVPNHDFVGPGGGYYAVTAI